MENARPRKRGNRFKTNWTREKIIEAIKSWNKTYEEPPRRTDWDPTRCKKLAEAAEEKAKEWRKRAFSFTTSRNWPSVRTVVEVFGSWNEAIKAAGLTPRLPSQRTARGTEPSPFLAPLGHVMSLVYEAEDTGDTETFIVALRRVSAIAEELAKKLERK